MGVKGLGERQNINEQVRRLEICVCICAGEASLKIHNSPYRIPNKSKIINFSVIYASLSSLN